MRAWALIAPASRGIGFALTRRVLQTTTAPVVATARKDMQRTKEQLLQGLGVDGNRLTVLRVDVLEESTIAAAAAACRDMFPTESNQLQLAFIVPGVLFPEKSPSQIEADDALLTLRTNTLGPMLMAKHFAPFLPKKNTANRETELGGLPEVSKTALMSARVGSIADNRLGGWYSYRASKAGVNQVVKTLDHHLRAASADRAMALGLHPGTVKTSLSKEFWGSVKKGTLLEQDWAAARLVDVIKGVGVEGRGRCWDWEGKEVPP